MENEHGYQTFQRPHRTAERSSEHRQIDRSETAVATKTHMSHPDAPTACGPIARLGVVQPLPIDSKLRGGDVVNLKVGDVAPHRYAVDRANIRRKKIGRGLSNLKSPSRRGRPSPRAATLPCFTLEIIPAALIFKRCGPIFSCRLM